MSWVNQLEEGYRLACDGMGWPTAAMLRLLLAVVMGGLIGLEREHNGHEAGFRTHALVCMGCALTMIVSTGFARVDWWGSFPGGEAIRLDPARVAYGVMGGIGFLGAGTIIQSRGHVRGLTTAAGVWSAAAVGLSIGLGQLVPPVFGTVLILSLLLVLNPISRKIPRERAALVSLRVPHEVGVIDHLRERFAAKGLAIRHIDVQHVYEQERMMEVCALVDCMHRDLLDRTLSIVAETEPWKLCKLEWVAD